jgi:hypothetical protein
MHNQPDEMPFNIWTGPRPLIAAAPFVPFLQNPPNNAAGWRTFAVLGAAIVVGIVLWFVLRGVERSEGD